MQRILVREEGYWFHINTLVSLLCNLKRSLNDTLLDVGFETFLCTPEAPENEDLVGGGSRPEIEGLDVVCVVEVGLVG